MKYNIYINRHAMRARAFLCRGKAIDNANGYYVEEELECSEKCMRATKDTAQENRIFKACYSPFEIPAGQCVENSPIIAYKRARCLLTKMETVWYMSKECAIKAAKKSFPQSDHIFITSLPLDLEMYEPAQFPMEVHLTYEKQRGKGKESLCARINTHPELDGKLARGKIFFRTKAGRIQ